MNPHPIAGRYVLIARHTVTIDACGVAWTDPVWWQDLKRHLLYLPELELVSPVCRIVAATNDELARMDAPDGTKLEISALPPGLDSLHGQIRALPRIVPILWRAAGRARFLQPDNIGWPTGWIGCVSALARGKRLVVIVENAHWRAQPNARIKRQIHGLLWEKIVRALTKRASVSFYTQPSYLQTIPPARGPGIVTPASWIDDDDLISIEEAERSWKSKGDRLRLLFAGRLVEEKGVGVLLDAIGQLRGRGCAADIDIIGSGALHSACRAAMGGSHNLRVNALDPVPYGPIFFRLLRNYHGVIVPLISDEQPRIIPDAYGQAVPVIGSDTDGVRPHVQHEKTGYLFPRGNADELAQRICSLAQSPKVLMPLGLAGLRYVQGMTHSSMHYRRWEHLAKIA